MGSKEEQRTVLINDKKVNLTSLDKPLWPDKKISKANYLQYLNDVAPNMLPFLKDRALTVIRFPHGAGKSESFFQKNCPDYAPDFIQTATIGDIHYIVCSDMATFIWLGNQLAFEFHVPFQTINIDGPSEIVFDLDPPSRDEFSLAIKAALFIKEVLDKLHLVSFIKTSGNKGLQIYIPLPDNQFSFEETRVFTSFVAEYLIEKEPTLFTTERLKKNRGNKLYLDVVQHAEGKTIIAPYSVRGNVEALVATPLFWNEVQPSLRPEQFPLETIIPRIESRGCPFSTFFETKKIQPFVPVLKGLMQQKKGS
ncbi:DNA ligase D [Scopulibacillus darangshiensis]|uniref:DNA ligase D n=1 Tax=Scopulibacillus darangshiensis TaxID=442528 RepID=A0A4R2P4N4_9BACL|nr:DNA ligase D [Scopulibacillus darangshiensis]